VRSGNGDKASIKVDANHADQDRNGHADQDRNG
jgi:hypothetical protein